MGRPPSSSRRCAKPPRRTAQRAAPTPTHPARSASCSGCVDLNERERARTHARSARGWIASLNLQCTRRRACWSVHATRLRQCPRIRSHLRLSLSFSWTYHRIPSPRGYPPSFPRSNLLPPSLSCAYPPPLLHRLPGPGAPRHARCSMRTSAPCEFVYIRVGGRRGTLCAG